MEKPNILCPLLGDCYAVCKQRQLKKDRKELVKYLKTGRVKALNYLVSNPFSRIDNDCLDNKMTELLFCSDFFVLAYKHYQRIAQIFDVADNIAKNAIFMSGFRGSGKTTFANYLKLFIKA